MPAIRWAKPPKYRNRKTECDGFVFDSAKEAHRWMELRLLERAGEIDRLERQPVYRLYAIRLVPPASRHVRDARPIPVAEITAAVGKFTPDFRYRTKDGAIVVEDCKSPATRTETAYRLRKRIWEANTGLTLTEV